ncbi:MAG: diadenylate cyclase CdaA [Bacteroidales bacterium]|nr:diadenylate cyclase CdaA [Bacteroidales bacterium]
MTSTDLLFIKITFSDILDILLVAYLLYAIYKLVKGSVAINILAGLLLIYFLWKMVDLANMRMLSEILNQFISVGVLALIIVFQPEIRKFLILLGQQAAEGVKNNRRFRLVRFFDQKKDIELNIDEIVKACESMAVQSIGALIIITRENELIEEKASGQNINASISAALVETIFYKNNPLHDGAMIISNNKIIASRCVLNITKNNNFPAEYGLRHRAAAGISEQTDAFAIVVSEQTGKISIADKGEVRFDISPIELKRTLLSEFSSVR